MPSSVSPRVSISSKSMLRIRGTAPAGGSGDPVSRSIKYESSTPKTGKFFRDSHVV